MLEREAFAVSAAAIAEARAFLRIDGDVEDGAIAMLVAAGLEAAEDSLGQAPIVRGYRERLPMTGRWQTLLATPVRSVTAAAAVDNGAVTATLAGSAYEVDIDACARGRVRVVVPPGAPAIEVAYTAGLASDWAAMAPAIRLGVLRLVVAWQKDREVVGEVTPDVDALWRGYRKLKLLSPRTARLAA